MTRKLTQKPTGHPVWMTIKGKCPSTPRNVLRSLRRGRVNVFGLITQRLTSGKCDLSKAHVSARFVKVRRSTIKLRKNREKFDRIEIHDLANLLAKQGLRICSDQEAFKLARHYKKQPKGERLYVASEIFPWGDDPCLFGISNLKSGRRTLDARLCDTAFKPDDEIVFAKAD